MKAEQDSLLGDCNRTISLVEKLKCPESVLETAYAGGPENLENAWTQTAE
jgi:hypothetical protein